MQLELLECLQCGHVQQSCIPSADELLTYYSHHYRSDYKAVYAPKKKHIWRAGNVALDRLQVLEGFRGEKQRLLDIGAGGGEFVYLAKKFGWDSTGIEPNLGYSEFARDNYEVEVVTGCLNDASASAVDVVTMFHVLEHMPDPISTMGCIHGRLRSGGLLFVEVPNLLQKDASPHNIFFKAHVQYFSKDTLLFSASQFFECLTIKDTGNLRAVFVKREQPRAPVPPSMRVVGENSRRFHQKSWLEYIFAGGGWRKPISRIRRLPAERASESLHPREILDQAANVRLWAGS